MRPWIFSVCLGLAGCPDAVPADKPASAPGAAAGGTSASGGAGGVGQSGPDTATGGEISSAPPMENCRGDGWAFETVDLTASGNALGLEIDSHGLPTALYRSLSNQLTSSTLNKDGIWEKSVLYDYTYGFSSSIDSSDALHVAYACGTGLCYARRIQNEEWELEPSALGISNETISQSTMGVDSSGTVHVLFDALEGGVYHASLEAGASDWKTVLVDSEGAFPSLAVGEDGVLHAAYTRAGGKTPGFVRYASMVPGEGWDSPITIFEQTPFDTRVLVAVQNGDPIVFFDHTGTSISLAQFADGAFSVLDLNVATPVFDALVDSRAVPHLCAMSYDSSAGGTTIAHGQLLIDSSTSTGFRFDAEPLEPNSIPGFCRLRADRGQGIHVLFWQPELQRLGYARTCTPI